MSEAVAEQPVVAPQPPVAAPAAAPAAEQPTKLFDLYNSLTGGKKAPKEKAPDKPVAKTVEEPKTEDKPEEVKPVVEEPEKKEKVRTRTRHVLTDEQPPVDTAGIAKAVADGVTDGLKRTAEQTKVKEQEKKEPEIPEMFAHRSSEFEVLEKLNPDKYGKGKLVKMLAKSAKKIADYQTSWEEQNPGKEFNPSEHTDEIDGLSPDIDPDDMTRAQARIETERATGSMRDEIKTLREQLDAQKLQAEIVPKAQAAATALGQSIIEEVVPELHKLAQSGDRAALEKYVTENPDLIQTVNAVLGEQLDDAHRAFVLMSPGGEKLVDQKKPSEQDVRILNHLLPTIESHMEGVEDSAGIKFTTWTKYQSMADSQKAKHRVITREVAQAVMKQMAVQTAKTRVSEMRARDEAVLKRYGYAIPGAKPAAVVVQPEPHKNGEVKTEKTASPASGAVTPGSGPAVRPASAKTETSKSPFPNLFSTLAGVR